MIIKYFGFDRIKESNPIFNSLGSIYLLTLIYVQIELNRLLGYTRQYQKLVDTLTTNSKHPGMYMYMHLSTHSYIIQNTCADTC